ncbi:MAG: FKBP-type peptidyl-prolyl cis-trans isomerase [Gemmatimonadales bacterium]|nr:FKBP-type peptidyl-prolyl cis-trans isomerase [Gemmatimonadales bacterium]
MPPLIRRLPIPLLLLTACAGGSAVRTPIPEVTGDTKAISSLRYIDISFGTGALAEPRKCFYVHYTSWLPNGKKFDSSRVLTDKGQPREPVFFLQGAKQVIDGWDIGFEGMRVGGARRLIVPYQLGYGERGNPPVIPARATLTFDVELMAVADPVPRCPTWAEVSQRAP